MRRPKVLPAGILICLVALVIAGCGGQARRSPSPSPSGVAARTPTPTPTSGGPSATPVATATSGGPTPVASPTPFPWPSGTPTPGPGSVVFGLYVAGTPAPGEELDLYFQAPQAGQNEFQLCGAMQACRPASGQVYSWSGANLSAGPSPWAFQRRLNGTTTTLASGTVDAGPGAVVTASTDS